MQLAPFASDFIAHAATTGLCSNQEMYSSNTNKNIHTYVDDACICMCILQKTLFARVGRIKFDFPFIIILEVHFEWRIGSFV